MALLVPDGNDPVPKCTARPPCHSSARTLEVARIDQRDFGDSGSLVGRSAGRAADCLGDEEPRYDALRYITLHVIVRRMIKTFHGKETERIWQGLRSRRLPQDIQEVARRKLRMLNNARALSDLRIPPANRLERLRGERLGQHSIRINDQWRVCFVWRSGDAFDVEIVDYH